MKRIWSFLWTMALTAMSGSIFAAESGAGVYEGFWTSPDGAKGRVTAQVRRIAGGKLDGFVAFYRAGTLEGAMRLKPGTGDFEGEAIKSSRGQLAPAEISGSAQTENGQLKGSFKGDFEGTFEAKLDKPKSPTLGAMPPKNGKVLFNGKPGEGWKDFRWKITPEGAMIAGGGDIHAKEKYANFLLHVEFRTPLMPEAEGQGRGNSGVYLQNKYEVQVLDSFGLFPLQNNDCGGIYTAKAPEVNVCLPPGEWQTYDITYVQGNAARGDAPTITVVHNGATVIDKFELPKKVAAEGTGGAEKDDVFLRLQDHNNPVEFRNIWVEPFFAADRK